MSKKDFDLALRKARTPEELQQRLDALKQNYTLDAYGYNAYIAAAGSMGQLDLAKRAYDTAITTNNTDAITHTSMMTAASRNSRIDLAAEAYFNAVSTGQYDDATHRAMLMVAHRHNRRDLYDIASQYLNNKTDASTLKDLRLICTNNNVNETNAAGGGAAAESSGVAASNGNDNTSAASSAAGDGAAAASNSNDNTSGADSAPARRPVLRYWHNPYSINEVTVCFFAQAQPTKSDSAAPASASSHRTTPSRGLK